MGQIGAYRVRIARGGQDMARVMAQRGAAFGAGPDGFDARAQHIMVERGDDLLASFRLTAYDSGAAMAAGSYSAQFYDLGGFAAMQSPGLELGRFCLAPHAPAADVLRLCFAAMAQRVDDLGAGLMFGCASFLGADLGLHGAALATLAAQISDDWRVGGRARHRIDLRALPPPLDPSAALRGLPPLLRSYIGIGGRVSDHAVQDFDLNTVHVFTAVKVGDIPVQRARALRAISALLDLG
jgi:putative hemolysin